MNTLIHPHSLIMLLAGILFSLHGTSQAGICDYIEEKASGPEGIDLSSLFDEAAESIHTHVVNDGALDNYMANKNASNNIIKGLQAQEQGLVQQLNLLKKQQLNAINSHKAAHPNASTKLAYKHANMKTNYQGASQPVKSQISATRTRIKAEKTSMAGFKPSKYATWGTKAKNFVKGVGQFFEAIDFSEAAAKVSGETYHWAFESGSFQNVLISMSNEAGRWKAKAVAAAGGAAAGTSTGPLAPIASPLLAGIAAGVAEKGYDHTIGKLNNHAKRIISDQRAKDLYAVDPQTLAINRAAARELDAEKRRLNGLKAKYALETELITKLIEQQKEWRERWKREAKAFKKWEKQQELTGPYSLVQETTLKLLAPGQSFAVDVTINGGKAPYTLSGAIDGALGRNEPGVYHSKAPGEPGDYELSLTSTDANGRTTSHTLKFNVKGSTKPVPYVPPRNDHTADNGAKTFTQTWNHRDISTSYRISGADVYLVIKAERVAGSIKAKGRVHGPLIVVFGEAAKPNVQVSASGSVRLEDGSQGNVSYHSESLKPEGQASTKSKSGNTYNVTLHTPDATGQPVSGNWNLTYPTGQAIKATLVSSLHYHYCMSAKLNIQPQGKATFPSQVRSEILYVNTDSPVFQRLRKEARDSILKQYRTQHQQRAGQQ